MCQRLAEADGDAGELEESPPVQARRRVDCDRHDGRAVAKRKSADARPCALGDLAALADAALRIDHDRPPRRNTSAAVASASASRAPRRTGKPPARWRKPPR